MLLTTLFATTEVTPAERVSVESDVRTVFSFFTLGGLRRLESAFRTGRVITGSYTAADGRGCLLYHLDRSITDADRHTARFASDPQAYAASQRLVAAWDGGRLSGEAVRSLLEQAIAEREKANNAEEQTILRVRSALAARTPRRTQGRPAQGGSPRPLRRGTRLTAVRRLACVPPLS